MANPTKTSQLPQVESIESVDRVVVLANTTGAAQTATIRIDALFGNSASIPLVNAPASSNSLSIRAGSIITDGEYLYIAVGDGVVKRVQLSAF